MDPNQNHSTFNGAPHHWSRDATSTRAVVDDSKGFSNDQTGVVRRDITIRQR